MVNKQTPAKGWSALGGKKYIFVSLLLAVLLVTPVLAQTITLEQIIQALQANPTLLVQVRQAIQQIANEQRPQPQPGCREFKRNFSESESSDDADEVRSILREESVSSVKEFQEKYEDEILRPIGLKVGTGYVGPATRKKLNELPYARCKPFITPTELGVAKVGENYNRQLTVHGLGSNKIISWDIVSGALPQNMNLSTVAVGACATGYACSQPINNSAFLNGAPTAAGTYTFTIQAANGTQTATQQYTLVAKDKDGNTGAPVISGISGPATLKVGETGTWTIQANDPNNKTLSYRVEWGDEPIVTYNTETVSVSLIYQQTTTFTHTYNNAGIFSPIFYVTNSQGLSAKTSISVNVGNLTRPAITVLSPNGGEQWAIKSVEKIKWFASGMEVDRVPKVDLFLVYYSPPCVIGQPCIMGMPAPISLDKNISGTQYNWIVATDIVDNSIPAGDYRVIICLAGSQTNCDFSDRPFTITSVTTT